MVQNEKNDYFSLSKIPISAAKIDVTYSFEKYVIALQETRELLH